MFPLQCPVIILLLKLGNDANSPPLHEQIHSSSCVLITLEKIMKNRMEYWVKTRKQKITINDLISLISLSSAIQRNFARNYLSIAFLDIAWAYDKQVEYL